MKKKRRRKMGEGSRGRRGKCKGWSEVDEKGGVWKEKRKRGRRRRQGGEEEGGRKGVPLSVVAVTMPMTTSLSFSAQLYAIR